ncbi:MAG: YfhO family protein, partial [Gemmiger sp.]
RKWGRFPFWVALNLLNNYFFFAGQAVFLILYFFCMLAGRRCRMAPRTFARLVFEALLGCALGCVLLLPAGLSLVQNPRTIDPFNGYGYLVYGKAQQYGAIFYSAFLMPDAPYLKDMFQEGILKHTSLTAWLPVVGLVGGLAFCRARRRHPFTRLLKVCVVCAFVPVLNSAFYALNSSYYARWYYMPVLVLCGATVMARSDGRLAREEVPPALGLVTAVTVSAAAFGLVPNQDADGNFLLGVVEEPLRFWPIWGVSLLGLALFAAVWFRWRHSPRLAAGLTAAVLAFSWVYGTVHLSITKYGQWETDGDLIAETCGSVEELNAVLPDDAFYRLDAYECYNNMGLWLDKSCIQFFNSTVAPSILEFYPSVGVKRDVNSKPEVENYALRGLLGVRFTLVPLDAEQHWLEEKLSGWTRTAETSRYAVYQNDNWVPLGTAYAFYVTDEQLEQVPEQQRANVLMKALLLEEDQIDRFGAMLRPLPEDAMKDRTYEAYVEDCAARRAAGVSAFTATGTGFTARCSYEADTLVLFAVPYDDGFSATVNGEAAEVLKVDHGLMAVAVPGGVEAVIEFTYHTPGLALSVRISLAALAVYAAYWLLMRRRRGNAPHTTIQRGTDP